MGDRNNPIKFGPEWLRNLSRERNASSSASNSQSPSTTGGTSGSAAGAAGGGIATSTVSPPNTSNTSNTAPKVQLAKLRYGREEMLALYDRTSEAPPELKYIDILYQPRGKPPVALNNSFEEEMRDAMRTGPPIGPMTGGERFGIGRGMGRGVNVTEGRGRARMPFVRQLSAGRGASWHLGSPRMPGFGAGADEEPTASLRSWNNNNGGNSAARGSGTEQTEWTPNKMYRSKRPGSNTNWRQSRDEEEWRVSDNNRTRSGQPDKWDRDWGERPTPDKQSWGSNRRNWVGGDSQNEENLPEWAVDNAEACAGTFDSSGAFHGYSNDDSNLPKTQESVYALTRSHTQGSFVRSKTAEEGSDEWWASEKAKKLSPKRFDASDVKFKKSNSVIPELSTSSSTNAKISTSKEDSPVNKGPEKPDTPTSTTELTENNASNIDDSFNSKKVRFSESKTFDALMRSDINLEEASDERGNFQSVMINSNNSLRQKHQNLVPANNNSNRQQNRKPGILRLIQNSGSQNSESELQKQHGTPDSKIVDDIMQLTLEDKEIISKLPIASDSGSQTTGTPGISSAIHSSVNSVSQMTSPAMQLRMSSPVHPTQGLAMTPKSNMASSGIQATGLPSPGMQQVGISNSALNASLGLPIGGPSNNPMGQAMGIPIQGISSPVMPNQGLANTGVGSAGLQPGGQGLPGFQTGGVHPGLSGSNVVNSSLFMGQIPNPTSLQSGDMQMSHGTQGNLFPLHGLQHSGSQAAFNSAMYGNIMQQNPVQTPPPSQNMAEQWYYEDPKKNIQGPFSSKEMYHWYRAGFFNETLMVRRACDAVMRPLGSYGPMVPFAQMDILSSFPMASSFESRSQGSHDSLITHSSQPGLGLDVMNMSNMSENNAMDTMQFGTVGLRNPPFGQQQMVDSLWSQPAPPDLMWMQQAMNARNETRVNNLPMFFWDHQASTIASNALLPEEIAKEMKTEDQILAQLRASQNIPVPPKIPFPSKQPVDPVTPASGLEGAFPPNINATPNLEELQKLIQEDTLKEAPHVAEAKINNGAPQQIEDTFLTEPNQQEPQAQNKSIPEPKAVKQTKTESEKSSKNKENNITKTKNNKKPKDDKKEDSVELKNKEDEALLAERRSAEPSPSKSKKEEKINKKELDKEKKEWIKEGFTIVKTEKTSNKDKKKADDSKIVEDTERKRREEERLAAEEEKKKRQLELLKKQQELQQQQQRLAAESIMKKAPWSASHQTMQAPSKDGMTLAEIQRLEREKKLEQMKEQQQMMQIIAQQQAAALAREQEMQAGLGWAKKKANLSTPGQSLAEIQAEARKQAVAATAAAAASQALEEAQAAAQQAPVNSVPWGNSHNGGGFWDTQPNQPSKPQEPPKPVDTNKVKKKPTVSVPAKKEVTPSAEFETWCTTVLASWSAKVDVPTFVGFLKDIESPYEVKDYVKCYLGDSKDSNDFARQFLERRSKLLRVGMVTPSDDLCSPAMAVNPRTTSGSDYQEVKCKGKKTKKNKMLKVDARILGFSVTAAEDRINVGDIDTV